MDSSAYGRRVPSAMKVKTLSYNKAETDSLPGIQLNDRQMKLYKAVKTGGPNGMKQKNHSLAPPPPVKKPQYSWQKTSEQEHPYLGQEPTNTAETVPNTFSDDTASQTSYSSRTSSNSQTRKNAANAFYGQRLNAQERKRYDDQGNTWRDSQSEASSSASAAASSVSAALSAASRNSRSSKASSSMGSMARLRQLQMKRNGKSSASSSAGSVYKSSASVVSVGSNSSKSVASVASSAKMSSTSVASVASSAKMSSASRSVASVSSRYAATTVKPSKPAPQEDEIMSGSASAAGSSTSALSRGSRSALSVNTSSERSFSQKLADKKSREENKPLNLSSQKDKNKFLRSTMMQWAKPSSSSSSVVSAAPSALKSTKSSTSTMSKSSKSSRRLSFAPKKSVITTDYRSPRSAVSGGSAAISPKEMAIMRKVADRNRSQSKTKTLSPLGKNPRRAAGKMIRSTSKRMKGFLSSSSSSVASADDQSNFEPSETLASKPRVLYDDSGQIIQETPSMVDDAPDDEAASILSSGSPKVGEVDRRKPIIMEEDVDDGEGDENIIFKNQQMRKKSKRGRSSIFKRRIGNIGMGVMDDLIDSNDELSSSDEEEDYGSSTELNDDYDVSIHQARSVKSSITPRKPKQETTTPRDIDSILEENKDFLNVMREGPLKQALNTPSIRNEVRNQFSAPVPTMSESFDADTEDFRTFNNALKAELSGTHSKLYDSFQAMFRCGEHGDNEPLKPLSVYPGSLDLKTKDSISKMSKYLNTEHDVECLISSQIVKDVDVRNYVFNRKNQKSSRDGYGSIEQCPSSDSINGGDDGSQFEVSLGQHARKTGSVVSSMHDSRFMSASKVKSTSAFKLPPSAAGTGTHFNQVKLKSRPVNDKSKNDSVPSSWTKVRLKPVNKPKANGRPSISTDSSETAEFHRIVLRKTPTNTGGKKHFDLGLQTVPSDVSGTENKPIALDKTVGNAEQPIKLTTPAFEGSSKKPIHLTPASGTGLKPIVVEDTGKGAEENPIKLAPSTGYDSTHPIQLVPSKGDESVNPIVLAPSIDLDLNEGSIVVPLQKEPEAGNDIDMKVLVGKDGITKIQSIPGQESTKANVIWRLERKDVKSALLDMSTFSVKVIGISNKDNKDLQFPTSAQCMKFANALHEMKNNNAAESSNRPRTSTGNDDASSVYVEQLSDEEQKILDEFRQRKKNGGGDGLSKQLLDMHDAVSKPMSIINGGEPHSPISEVSAATSAPADKSKIEKKFQLMLKMKVPKEAVKAKMEQEGVDPSTIAKILGAEAPKESTESEKPKAPSSNLSPEDEKKAGVYRRMLKMMVPPEAVAHKMKKDGIDQKIVIAVLGAKYGGGDSEQQESKPALPSLTIPEQAAAQKYQKMLKMNVPREAVEHKMKKDGADEKIIAFVLGQASSAQSGASAPATKKKAAASSLSSAEESIAATYRRMLKMNLPKDAVQHKMKQDGVSEKIMCAVLGKSMKQNGNDKAKKGGFGAGFHWNAIDDDVSIVGSVWSKAKTSSEVGASNAALDILKHVEEFQKKPETSAKAKKSTGNSAQGNKEMANLINGNRKQNVAITLKAFNDFTYKELSQTIEFLDPCGKIKGDRALFMKDLLPTDAEVKIVRAYNGSDEHLDTAERWFRQIVNVKRIEEKVQVMRTIETFKMDAIILGKSFQLLTDVCNQVMSSDRLPDLLDMVRQIGNRMNQGRGDDAAGFKLDFLPRLAQTKGSDKKTTALDLVVLIFCTRNQREALMLSDDYPDIQEASRMQFDDLNTDVRGLEASFRKCKTEFQKLQQEHDSSGGKSFQFNSDLQTDSKSDTALAKPNRKFSGNDINTDVNNRKPAPMGLSLMDQIKSRNGSVSIENTPSVGEVLNAIHKSNEEVRKSLSPRASLMASLQAKNQGQVEFSLEASIRRLEKFVGETNYVIMPKLQAQRDEAVEACKNLASFFCEAPSERTASNLLKILAGFATGIDQAVKKYDEQQKILARREAAMKKKKNGDKASKPAKKNKLKLNPFGNKKRPAAEAPSKPTQAEVAANGEKKSLVLMVNEMLKVAGDKEIEDYVSGKTDAVAGSRLEEIYKEEKIRKTTDREDILSAIQRRRSVSTNLASQQALSDLRATLSEDARDEFDEKRRKSRVANRWGSRREAPTSNAGSLPPRAAPKLEKPPKDTEAESSSRRRKSRVVNRWSSKPVHVQPSTPASEALSSISENSFDVELQKKRRQSVVNRWASNKSAAVESLSVENQSNSNTGKDIADDESIGAFEEMIDKRKQKAFNRWASKNAAA